MNNKIRVSVDDFILESDDELKASRSMLSSLVSKIKQSSIEVDAEILSKELGSIYATLVSSISNLQDIAENVEIDNVQFSIGIDSTGQVSLLSTISGASQTKTGIVFTIRFKK